MRKPKCKQQTPKQPSLVRLEDYDEVMGLDPGRNDLFTTCNLTGEHQHYSTRRFYDEAS